MNEETIDKNDKSGLKVINNKTNLIEKRKNDLSNVKFSFRFLNLLFFF